MRSESMLHACCASRGAPGGTEVAGALPLKRLQFRRGDTDANKQEPKSVLRFQLI